MKYSLRFTKGDNGPYTLQGSPMALYRAIIHLIHDKPHVQASILDDTGHDADQNTFMEAVHQDEEHGYFDDGGWTVTVLETR